MHTLLLIRHGRTAANEARLYCGSSDVPLSPGGREELRVLRERGGYPDLCGYAVYTSGLRRTEETLAELYGEIAHRSLPDTAEMDFGVFELHSYEQLKEDPDYQRWISGDNERNVCPGGESGEEMTRRVLATLPRLLAQEQVLLVSHGGPIAAILAQLFPGEGRNRYEWQPKHGCGYRITVSDDGTPLAWQPVPAR